MVGRKIYLDFGSRIYGIEIFPGTEKNREDLCIKRSRPDENNPLSDWEVSSVPVYSVFNDPDLGKDEAYLGEATGVVNGQDLNYFIRHGKQFFITKEELEKFQSLDE